MTQNSFHLFQGSPPFPAKVYLQHYLTIQRHKAWVGGRSDIPLNKLYLHVSYLNCNSFFCPISCYYARTSKRQRTMTLLILFYLCRQTGQVVQSRRDPGKVLTSATGVSALPQVLTKFSNSGQKFSCLSTKETLD